jgi:arylsulfatase A-like enzyme
MYSEIGIDKPSLERLAEEGVRFHNAITPHPLCVPARTSVMTGRYPHSTGHDGATRR